MNRSHAPCSLDAGKEHVNHVPTRELSYEGVRLSPELRAKWNGLPYAEGQKLLTGVVDAVRAETSETRSRVVARGAPDKVLTDRVYDGLRRDFESLGIQAYLPPREDICVSVSRKWLPIGGMYEGGYSEPGTFAGRVQIGFENTIVLSRLGKLLFSKSARTRAEATVLYTAYHEMTHGLGTYTFDSPNTETESFEVGERGLAKLVAGKTGRLVLEETLATLNGMAGVIKDPTLGSKFEVQEGNEQFILDDPKSFGLSKETVDDIATLYGPRGVKECPASGARFVNIPTVLLVGTDGVAIPSRYELIAGTALSIAAVLYKEEGLGNNYPALVERVRIDMLRQLIGQRTVFEEDFVGRVEKQFGSVAVQILTGILLPHEEHIDSTTAMNMQKTSVLLFGALARVLRQSGPQRDENLAKLLNIVNKISGSKADIEPSGV